MAAQGVVDQPLVEAFLERAYFQRMPPKSLDRNDFADILELVSGHSDADACATLTMIAAASVVRGMGHCLAPPARVLVTGGGRSNPVLMAMLAAGLDCPVVPVENVGLDGDMLEAQAFAYLAVRRLRGLPTSSASTTGVASPVGGGRISWPSA